jgi:adenylylsulfate kinase
MWETALEKGWCVWITGLPGSGKSTVANLLLSELESLSIHTQIVSIDMIRQYATPQPTYSEEERATVYGALVFAAKTLTENGINVIIDATGNRRHFRERARKAIPRFIEAYLECPLGICMDREAKRENTHLAPTNIYKKSEEDKATTVPGIGAPYEEPLGPEVKVDSSDLSPEECAEKIFTAVKRYFLRTEEP